MPRNRRKRNKKPSKVTFLDVLDGQTFLVDDFIQYFQGFPGFTAWIEDGEIIMDRYTDRYATYQGARILVYSKSKFGPGQLPHNVV